MKEKKKTTAKLTVVKNEEEVKEEKKLGKPTDEEVAQYKAEFDEAMKNFANTRWAVSDPGTFAANDVGLFLKDFLAKHSLWTKTGWMGLIKMNAELENAIKMDNEKTGLTLDYQALEFCGYMLMNPGGIGLSAAIEFEKIADKYSKIMVDVGKKVEEARETLKGIQYLQDKWSAGVQGFYLAELEPKETQPSEGDTETPPTEEIEGKVIEMKIDKKEE